MKPHWGANIGGTDYGNRRSTALMETYDINDWREIL
jgi:hypothetical protein